jgi:hypothetical protein
MRAGIGCGSVSVHTLRSAVSGFAGAGKAASLNGGEVEADVTSATGLAASLGWDSGDAIRTTIFTCFGSVVG